MFKFNNGNGALVCDKCRIIIREPYEAIKGTDSEKKDYCLRCQITLDQIKTAVCELQSIVKWLDKKYDEPRPEDSRTMVVKFKIEIEKRIKKLLKF